MNQNERVQAAREARSRWMSAIESGMNHGDVNDRWNSYVSIANLAGPETLRTLERESDEACIGDPSHQFHSHDEE